MEVRERGVLMPLAVAVALKLARQWSVRDICRLHTVSPKYVVEVAREVRCRIGRVPPRESVRDILPLLDYLVEQDRSPLRYLGRERAKESYE